MEEVMNKGSLRPRTSHRLFESADIDDAREKVSRVYCGHKLTPPDASRGSYPSHVRIAGGMHQILRLMAMQPGVVVE